MKPSQRLLAILALCLLIISSTPAYCADIDPNVNLNNLEHDQGNWYVQDDEDFEALKKKIMERVRQRLERETESILDEVEKIIDAFEKQGINSKKPYLGAHVKNVTDDIRGVLGLSDNEAVMITSLVDGGPADNAGFQKSDIILQFDGKDIKGLKGFKNLFRSCEAGSTHTLTILRRMREKEVSITFGSKDGKQGNPGNTTQTVRRVFEESIGKVWNELKHLNKPLAEKFRALKEGPRDLLNNKLEDMAKEFGINLGLAKALAASIDVIQNGDLSSISDMFTQFIMQDKDGRLLLKYEYKTPKGITRDVMEEMINYIFQMDDDGRVRLRPRYRKWCRRFQEVVQDTITPTQGPKKMLGVYIEDLDEEEYEELGGGTRVIDIVPNSIAEAAGIEAGDIILKWGTKKKLVKGQADLRRHIQRSDFDTSIPIIIIDEDGEDKTVTIRFAKDNINSDPKKTPQYTAESDDTVLSKHTQRTRAMESNNETRRQEDEYDLRLLELLIKEMDDNDSNSTENQTLDNDLRELSKFAREYDKTINILKKNLDIAKNDESDDELKRLLEEAKKIFNENGEDVKRAFDDKRTQKFIEKVIQESDENVDRVKRTHKIIRQFQDDDQIINKNQLRRIVPHMDEKEAKQVARLLKAFSNSGQDTLELTLKRGNKIVIMAKVDMSEVGLLHEILRQAFQHHGFKNVKKYRTYKEYDLKPKKPHYQSYTKKKGNRIQSLEHRIEKMLRSVRELKQQIQRIRKGNTKINRQPKRYDFQDLRGQDGKENQIKRLKQQLHKLKKQLEDYK